MPNKTTEGKYLEFEKKVKEVSGKSIMSSWTPDQFSRFLVSFMRYKNMDLFLILATNIKRADKYLTYFLDHVKNNNPVDAINILSEWLLIWKPKGWSLKSFNSFLADRKREGTEPGSPYACFGKIELVTYLLHVETKYFRDSLTSPDLSTSELHQIIQDWKEVAVTNIIEKGPKNHFLRNNILGLIIKAAIRLQVQHLEYLKSLSGPDSNSIDKLEAKELISAIQSRVCLPIMTLLEQGNHDFNKFQLEEIGNEFYSNVIALHRNDLEYCRNIAENFLSLIYYNSQPAAELNESKISKLFGTLSYSFAIRRIQDADTKYRP